MMKIIITLFLLLPSFCFGAINTASVNNGSFTLTGSGFGTTDYQAEWTGQNIEDGTNGSEFSKSSWVNSYSNKAVYSTADKHSGSKSILFDFYDTVYARALDFDMGSEDVQEAYFTAWVKIKKNDDAEIFQWKNWKIKNTPGYTFETTIYGENWWYDVSGWGNTSIIVMRNTVSDQSSKRTVEADGFLLNEWQRLEAYYKKSSSTGANDGVFEWRRVGRAGGEVIVSNYNVITHDSTNENQLWRYFLVGHYYGNLLNSDYSDYTGTRDAEIYYDDIYINRSRARVEIGDASTFASCTHREVQPAITWTPTGITGTFNLGSFAADATVYFFVVDADGVPSAGKLVNLSGTPTYDQPTITGPDDFSTTEISVEIEGVYTVDPDLSDQSVIITWTLGEGSGFAVAALGVFSCTVPDIMTGTNSIVFRVADSNDGEDSDTTVVTRTATQNGFIYTGSMSGGTYI